MTLLIRFKKGGHGTSLFLFLILPDSCKKTALERRLGVLENLYSGNLYAFYSPVFKDMPEVTLGDKCMFPIKYLKKTAW